MQDGSINELIGAEGERVFVAEVRDLPKACRRALSVEASQAVKIVCTGHIAAPVSADLG
jgi:hypothetical protein